MDRRTQTAIAVSVASVLGQTALQLSDYHNVPLAIGLAVITVLAVLYAMWHGINEWRDRHNKPSIKLEPSHVIIIGLLIAAAGVAWQLTQARANPTTGIATTVSPSDQPIQTAKKFYAASDKERISNALYDLYNILNTTGAEINKKKNRFLGDWDRFQTAGNFNVQGLLSELDELRNLTVQFHRSIYDDENGLLKKYQNYNDELTQVLDQSRNVNSLSQVQITANNCFDGISIFEMINTGTGGDEQVKSGLRRALRTQVGDMNAAEEKFEAWMISVKQRGDALRNSFAAN